ncbi:glycosyltransferase family 4 protein [Candidatus Falkowbacteria bacterium]|nr:glycosyltransferase family 4 protein [Candidatus Falkowbacteria bacterium]
MKILILSLAYHPFIGGAEVAIKEITDRIDDVNFDLVTVNLDGRQRTNERLGNVNIYRLGSGKISKYFFPWAAYKKASQLHHQNKYDLVWAMMANQAGLAALKFKKQFPGVKYFLTLQEGDSEFDIWLRTWFIRPLYKAIYRRADYIQAISNFLAQRAKRLGAECPVEVVPNGVAWVATDGNYSRGDNVITTSRLTKKNGIRYLIEAMQYIDRELLILGDGELRSDLEELVNKLDLKNKVKFLGHVSYEEVYKYLSQSSVFVRPSLSEGLGNAFLEAMTMGVPIIGTSVGGIPDFLIDGQTGWFCRPKDPKSTAEKINYILDPKNAETVNHVVVNARKLVREQYNWDKIAQRMKNIFLQLK